jgi:hypothetical protein
LAHQRYHFQWKLRFEAMDRLQDAQGDEIFSMAVADHQKDC